MSELSWKFPVQNDAQFNGLSNSQEFFKSDKIASLTREICQNSIDAVNDENIPVCVEFERKSIKTTLLPDIGGLKHNIKLAYDQYSHKDNPRDKEYFQNALKVLSGEFVDVMRISDFNTKGLIGSHETDRQVLLKTPWWGLTRGQGFSDKTHGAGGSHGIGKNAIFACSAFGTVFFSTYDKEKNQAWQGLSVLASYFDDNGNQTIGTGYLNDKEQNVPVLDKQVDIFGIPTREKTQYGTDIYIIGLISTEVSVVQSIVAATIDNFFMAIKDKMLKVSVIDGTQTTDINDSTLYQLASAYESVLLPETKDFIEVLTSENTKLFSNDNFMESLGRVELYLNISNPAFKKRVAMIRKNGMLIRHRIVQSSIGCAGVFYLKGIKLNELLADVENPTHTKWEPQHVGIEKARYAETVIKSLTHFINDSFSRLITSSEENVIDSSVGDFLPDIGEGENKSKRDVLSDKIEEITQPKRIKTKSKNTIKADFGEIGTEQEQGCDDVVDSAGAGHSDGEYSTGGNGAGPNEGDEVGTEYETQPHTIVTVRPISVYFFPKDIMKGEWVLTYTPAIDARNASMKISISGESQSIEAKILNVSDPGNKNLKIVNNSTIEGFDCFAEKTLRFILKFDSRIAFSIEEPEVYGNK